MTKAQKTLKEKKAFKDEIENCFQKAESVEIWRSSEIRLEKMYQDYEELPKGVKAHTDSFIFPAAAIYLAAKEFSQEKAYSIIQGVMKELSLKRGESFNRMVRMPGGKSLFLKMWDVISHKMFSEDAGFKNVFYPKKKGEFKMDITQCPYSTYLSELGCPELTSLFCKSDEYSYGNLDGLMFTRTSTIGAGGTLCDFKLEKIAK